MRDIAEIYNRDPEYEWNRLTKNAYSRLEFLIFMHHIRSFLPKQGLILDAGGGPGRYALELCRLGHQVVLFDLSPACIELAERKLSGEPIEIRKRLKDMIVGDVRNLNTFENESFDAVLCLDPLSCMPSGGDRDTALSEVVRVAKPGAAVFLGVRGYLDVLRTILRIASHELVQDTIGRLKTTGNTKTSGVLHHFFRAGEIRELAERHGLETLRMAGGEGLSGGMPEATAAIAADKDKWEQWLEILKETSIDPAVADLSGHILYIGRKI